MGHRIVFIGAGKLATNLSVELKKQGHTVEQVYSRTEASASLLARNLQSLHTTIPENILPGADIYIVALKDSVVDDVLSKVNFGNKLVVHCSGSLPLSALSKYSSNTGVLYPLQTFSMHREVNFKEVPVFIEGSSKTNEALLVQLAETVSKNVSVLDSEKRLFLHIAAVFACNYLNHLLTISTELLNSRYITFDVLHPLIRETVSKALLLGPVESQTGPAVRYDQNIISAHLKALESFPEFRKLYEKLSTSIHNHHKIKHQ
jgi:predicted short-subunit dehydrogenase-like oxidoreductase (DUF2520 family)